MLKYAKIIDENTGAVEVGIGNPDAVYQTVTDKDGTEKTLYVSDFYKSLGMALMEVEQGCDGAWYVAGKVPVIPATVAELTEFLYQEKCKIAYGGVTVIKGGEKYLFETTQDSITMCNSMALALSDQPDDYTVSWKVWADDMPVMLTITKPEFNAIFAFGMLMINTAFAVEGALNLQAQALTDEQLAIPAFIDAFKATAVAQLAAVQTVFSLDPENE